LTQLGVFAITEFFGSVASDKPAVIFLDDIHWADDKSLEAALTRIDEAQRAAGQLNQDANALAADAAKTIDDVLGRIANR